MTKQLARALAFGLIASLVTGVRADIRAQDSSDAAEVLEALREAQREFERYRESRTPVEQQRVAGYCDENIGRICIWFGGDEEEEFPGELREVGQARIDLVRSLFDGFEVTADPWILGQLVHYLVESREMGEAQRVAQECGIEAVWWCSALDGYVLHVWTRYEDAERAFREALETMPEPLWFEWTSPRYVYSGDAVDRFDDLPPADRMRQFELLWRLSDPFFIYQGNDRFTDHFARWVVATNREGAGHPLGLEWAEDLEETLVRYGRNTGYSRTINLAGMGIGNLTDTRRMVGHHHPKSRGYLFPEEFLEAPADIPAESWITAPREARTWYAPPYAPDVRGLETQVGRFRRDDRMLVVGAYRPTVAAEDGRGVLAAWRDDGGIEGEPLAALFLIPEDGGAAVFARGNQAEGVLAIEATPGRYVSSLEVVDVEGRRGWRARQGVVQAPLAPGLVDVSDLMILREGAPRPRSLEDGLDDIRPDVRLRRGEQFSVLWEVYGLRIREPVQVSIGFSPGRPGFLERVGDFLGLLEPDQSVDITFDDAGPDVVQSIFRTLQLTLPDLDPGAYTLHLRIDLPGRTPVIRSRPILVEDGG